MQLSRSHAREQAALPFNPSRLRCRLRAAMMTTNRPKGLAVAQSPGNCSCFCRVLGFAADAHPSNCNYADYADAPNLALSYLIRARGRAMALRFSCSRRSRDIASGYRLYPFVAVDYDMQIQSAV